MCVYRVNINNLSLELTNTSGYGMDFESENALLYVVTVYVRVLLHVLIF